MTYVQPTEVIILKGVPPLLTGPLFTKLEACQKKIIVLQGGGDSLKTGTTLQWLAVKAIQKKRQITISGVDIPNLRRGAIRLFKRYILYHPQIEPFVKVYNLTNNECVFNTGSIMSFVSFEDAVNARGSENDIVFMNEVNLQTYDLFWELQRKCREKIIMDYNPTYKFFVHAKLIPDDNGNSGEKQFQGQVQVYITDHRHNPFLSEEDHDNYESISDPERFKVYARGETGKTKGAVFNFTKIDKIPDDVTDWGIGCDWGYNLDFTAISKIWFKKDKRYIKLIYYKCGVDIDEIVQVLKENGCVSSTLIWGDHDKNISINLRRKGIPYRMARKGPNSLTASISCVKSKDIYYLESEDLEKELLTYQWAQGVDLLTGNEVSLNVPVDGMRDDALASIRYFIYSQNLRFIDDN